MPGHDIIVIGASAGGMEALKALVTDLSPDLPASVFVVWHIAAHSIGVLPDVLARLGPLPATNARDGESIQPGHIYVAPPDHHLLVERDHIRLTRGPKENRFRPAVDTLFRAAANAYGPRVVGVVLSGSLDDGTAGLWAIKDCGGIAVVQDPDEALEPSMPGNALELVDVDYCLPVADIAKTLNELAWRPVEEGRDFPFSDQLEVENRIALEGNPLESGLLSLGVPSLYTCPECHGTLVQLNTGGILRFRCHTGHAFSINSLLDGVNESIDKTLWAAIRAVEERALLLRHLAHQLQETGDTVRAEYLKTEARAAERQEYRIRQIVFHPDTPTAEPSDPAA